MSILVIGQSNGFIVRQGRQSRMSSNASSTASSAPSSVDQHHAHSHSNSDSGLSSLTGTSFSNTLRLNCEYHIIYVFYHYYIGIHTFSIVSRRGWRGWIWKNIYNVPSLDTFHIVKYIIFKLGCLLYLQCVQCIWKLKANKYQKNVVNNASTTTANLWDPQKKSKQSEHTSRWFFLHW